MSRSRKRRGQRDGRARAEMDVEQGGYENTGRADRPQAHRKDGQIIAQVRRGLEHVLRFGDGPGLMLLAIDPVPDASRLVITLAPMAGTVIEVAALPDGRAIVASLRWELARMLARKRLPELRVIVLPAAPVWEGGTDA